MAISFTIWSLNGLIFAAGGSIFAGILFFIGKCIYNLFFHPLASYPGPWLGRATRLHYIYHQLAGDLPYKTLDWHNTYGEVVRVAPDELSYNSSRAYHDVHVWRDNDLRSGLEKDKTWYSQSINSVPVIVTAENKDHSRLRGIMVHAFSDRALARQEPLITSYVELLIRRLRELPTDQPIDMVPWFTSTAMDVILDLSFGKSVGCLENTVNGELHPWVRLTSGHVKQGLYVQAWRRLPAFISRNALVNLVLARVGRVWMEQFQVTTRMARERIAAGTGREDFVTHLLRENSEKDGMTIPELEIASSIFMTAGSDTNATLVCGCLYYALRDAKIWSRLANEIRGSVTQESEMTFTRLQKLPFLNAVIEEALRVYVVVPTTFPRRTPARGAKICGRFVPGDYAVGMNGYAAALSEKNFARASEFHPERWLAEPDPRFERDDKKAHQPFSTGPRNCLGKSMALAFARSVIARLVWNFDVQLAPESRDWAANQDVYVMFVKTPLMCWLKQRNST
ncbi:probable sterigmatocystin biosynthesis P450 monooxygenase stcL [Aspergillus udagawae]|uniref:Probable sterigmatocystin biosynthesis P450 monooxygenase stcL n=1 Tax=Aspergillus udagawae TaxID=91492 RepID=A0A8E0QLI5_9EURO|nr:uncharacterized protein Aud_003881 [Aspergillus udagawae]GFF55340.1 probable sterigmatocystin biosynthesis P450 monooxygenase stcL [Aspergillus udagawae]GIC87497.1 hypothetical protein Aud_003881 [Aspergillus udagawae]